MYLLRVAFFDARTAFVHWCAFDANGALLEVRFAGNRVKRSESNNVGVSFRKVKRHEDLPRSNNARNAEFEIGHGPATAANGYTIVGFEVEMYGVSRVHLEPSIGDHVIKKFDLRGFCTSVPVFDGATGIEDEVELRVRLLDEGIAGNDMEASASILGGKDAISVE